MAEDSVRRTEATTSLSGYGSRAQDEHRSGNRRAAPADEVDAPPSRGADSVAVRSDFVAALRLLRERVLANTRDMLGVGSVAVPKFAEVVGAETTAAFVSRLVSDQNQLAARGASAAPSAVRVVLNAAFEAGSTEAAELLAAVPDSAAAQVAVSAARAEFGRRIAELDS